MNRPEPLSISEIVDKIVTAKFDDKIFGPFYCKVCTFDGTSSEDSTTHLKSRDHALRVSTLASSKTLVWWDINRCRVPEGCDPRLVVPIIKRELEKSGFSGGPLTITAIGDLKHTLKQTPDVLPAISSSGILLKHEDKQCLDIMTELFKWTAHNPPPATIMLITGNVKCVLYTGLLQDKGYTVFLYPAWVHLMPFQINLRQATDQVWLSETGESAWCCILCRNTHKLYDGKSFDGERFDGERFEDFTMHLEGRGHALALRGITPLISKRQSSCLHPNDATTMVDTRVISNMQSSCLHPNDATTVGLMPLIKEEEH